MGNATEDKLAKDSTVGYLEMTAEFANFRDCVAQGLNGV